MPPSLEDMTGEAMASAFIVFLKKEGLLVDERVLMAEEDVKHMANAFNAGALFGVSQWTKEV